MVGGLEHVGHDAADDDLAEQRLGPLEVELRREGGPHPLAGGLLGVLRGLAVAEDADRADLAVAAVDHLVGDDAVRLRDGLGEVGVDHVQQVVHRPRVEPVAPDAGEHSPLLSWGFGPAIRRYSSARRASPPRRAASAASRRRPVYRRSASQTSSAYRRHTRGWRSPAATSWCTTPPHRTRRSADPMPARIEPWRCARRSRRSSVAFISARASWTWGRSRADAIAPAMARSRACSSAAATNTPRSASPALSSRSASSSSP